MTNDEPKDKLVLVIDYELVTGDEQDIGAVIEALREWIESDDVWLQDDDTEAESAYSFAVRHVEVVDADVVEIGRASCRERV